MTFCNPFLQFNFASTFAFGNYLGNCFRQTLFGNLWGNCGWNNFGTNFNFTPPGFYMAQNCGGTSIFNNCVNWQTQSFGSYTGGFDSFTYSGNGWGCNTFDNSWDYYSSAFNSTATIRNFTTQSVSSGTGTSGINNGRVANLAWWKEQGYNEEKGTLFASNTKRHSNALRAAGEKGQCGKGVRLGINDTFYSGNQHYQRFGKAKDTGTDFLSKDSHFKKVNISGMHLTKDMIPAGAIVIYDAGYSNGLGETCGHIEVSDGNGCGYSDVTTTLLSNYGNRREPKEIWIPV